MSEPVNVQTLRAKAPLSGIDPNVKIPPHVLAAGKRSEEIQRMVNGEAEPSVAEQHAQVNGEAAPPVTPPGNPEPSSPPQPENEPVDWEQRFKRLQGRHETDTKRNRDAITMLSERIELMDRELAAARAGAPPAGAPPAAPQSLITEQELQDYGPELVDIMRRVAAETSAPLIAEIQRLSSGLGHVQQETGNVFLNRMHEALNAAVPNWVTLNDDPNFIAWSRLPDIFSGAIRRGLMQEAWDSGDARRVIAFFHAFLAEEAALNPSGGRGQARTVPRTVVGNQSIMPPPAPTGPTLDLTALASPGRAHSAGGAPAEKPVYTSADITRFYTEVSAGKWRGREQQQAAVDADIMEAQREGRIITNPRTQAPRDQFTR